MNASVQMTQELVRGLVAATAELTDTDVAVFPPFPYLAALQELAATTTLAWGAQNLGEQRSGAYTGEVAASMLVEFGCRYVLVGHSERRALYGESDRQVAAKVAMAQQHSLVPILCVGETLAQREAEETQAVVGAQLDAVLEGVGVAGFRQLIVAYEPVWAIGTGLTASPGQAQAVHAYIRNKVSALDATIGGHLRILYGGSVKGTNAAELFAMEDIDGGLIGGASLKLDEFLSICRA